ncbi:GWxTD domain-containing protein [Rubrivirga sp. IMCC43871]|uniref:GWxTD domain-containing protein n=1 Tax=Rubrivirga sp. IMCC43871 TaxID=3391575 RepID=UPI00398FD887
MRAASALALLLLASACAGPSPARLDTDAAAYRAGEPAFVLDVAGVVGEPGAIVDVLVGVAPAALAFRPGADSLEAVVRWTISLEREGGAPRVMSALDTVRVASLAEARSTVPSWTRERFPVAPGLYTVRALLDDAAAGRTAERRAEVLARAPGGLPRLAALRVVRGPEPVDATAIPAGLDSLALTLQAIDLVSEGEMVVTVARVRSDSLPATSVDASTPFVGSLSAQGIDRSALDTVAVPRQRVGAGTSAVVAPLPTLRPGVYRLTVAVDGSLTSAARYVVVRRQEYPLLTRLGDLIAPLAYLADSDALRPIHEARTEAARRRAFDGFWGAEMDDRRLAAATIRAYYERVEQANRLFAGVKEGWKTDPGMIYVLFGPPRFVETRDDGERWTYGAGVAGPVSFTFRRTSGAGPFPVLTLERDRALVDPIGRARQQWRRGVVP